MDVISSITEMKEYVLEKKRDKKTISFVPTMGFLHKGHIELIKYAQERADYTILSIFVNPIQFGQNEDFNRYPRDLDGDLRKAKESGVNCVFLPSISDMYPEGFQTYIEVTELQKGLCGDTRPGHFKGVATVVCKLFNIIKADYAIFGKKDYQQYVLIKKMVEDLNMDIKILGYPTVREESGLACSSRNAYLSDYERNHIAPNIYKSLQLSLEKINKGETNPNQIKNFIRDYLLSIYDFKIDYIFIGNKHTLKEMEIIDKNSLIAVAVWLNNTRLIDNIEVCTE